MYIGPADDGGALGALGRGRSRDWRVPEAGSGSPPRMSDNVGLAKGLVIEMIVRMVDGLA